MAAASEETQIVEDVSALENYIACDEETQSEIVVPVYDSRDQLWAVLDIDSEEKSAFSNCDQENLEMLCNEFFREDEGIPAADGTT